MNTTTSEKSSMLKVFSIRDFRLLWAGSATSILGDQFSFIAMPWLVLKLTGDPLALGIVLALEGIPRTLFMLVGGALTDRFSPRAIMMAADIIRLFLAALMAALVFSGAVEMWMVYAIALCFGLVAGFAIPASNSIIPHIVPEADLQAGNSASMGVTQLISFVGPTLAGIVIAGFSKSPMGIILAFSIDAFSFLVSAAALSLMRGGRQRTAGQQQESIWESILSGLRYMWHNPALRFLFITVSFCNFFFTGPLLVGIPVLANQRLVEGAVAFGLLMSAYAGGNLGGYLLAGSLPRPSGKRLTTIVITLLFAFGIVYLAIGWITSTWADFVLMLLLGVGNGYIGLLMFTWFQAHTPKEMLGRLMSMLMLSSTGLVPISQALAGMVSRWSLTGLFVVAGLLGIMLALWASIQPGMKILSENIVGEVKSKSQA
jgi:MFS family permease